MANLCQGGGEEKGGEDEDERELGEGSHHFGLWNLERTQKRRATAYCESDSEGMGLGCVT